MTLFLFLVLTKNLAFAVGGTEGSGGGNAIVCPRQNRVYLADTYDVFSKYPKSKFAHVDGFEITKAMYRIADRNPNLRKLIDKGCNRIHGGMFSGQPLPFLPDHIVIPNSDCYRQQLAIQDLASGLISVDPDLYAQLTGAERAIFEVHECLIQARHLVGDTTGVRQQIDALIDDKNFLKELQFILKDPQTRVLDDKIEKALVQLAVQAATDLTFIYYHRFDHSYKSGFYLAMDEQKFALLEPKKVYPQDSAFMEEFSDNLGTMYRNWGLLLDDDHSFKDIVRNDVYRAKSFDQLLIELSQVSH